MKQMLILLLASTIVVAKHLTHQTITKRLEHMPNKLNVNQHKWFTESNHNELIFFKDNKHSIMNHIAIAYLEKYQRKYPTVEIYVVYITRIKQTTGYGSLKAPELLFLASELIKHCKSTGKNNLYSRYNYHFECLKNVANEGYSKFAVERNTAELIYVEGSLPGHDFYSTYLTYYMNHCVIPNTFCPTMVIALQKDKNTEKVFDINDICENLKAKFDSDLDLKLTILRKTNLVAGGGNRRVQQSILVDKVTVKKGQKLQGIKNQLFTHYVTDLTNGLEFYVVNAHEAREPFGKLMLMAEEYYPVLVSHKNIGGCILKIRKMGYKCTLNIQFTYFLIKNQNLPTVAYEYEVLVMVMVLYDPDHMHVGAYKYPVNDAKGDDPIVDFDENLPYYTKMMEHSNKTGHIIDTLYQTYVKGGGYSFQDLPEFLNIFNMKNRCFYDVSFEDEVYKTYQSINTYHQKNKEFIKKLKELFGNKVSIKLFDVCLRSDPHLESCSYFRRERGIIMNSICNKELSLEEYENYRENNLLCIFMLITISDDTGTKSSYSFLQDRDYSCAHVLAKNLQQPNYSSEINDFLWRTILSLKSDDDFLCKLQNNDLETTTRYTDYIKNYLTEISVSIVREIKKDLCRFIYFDRIFYQTVIFLALENLPPLDLDWFDRIACKQVDISNEQIEKPGVSCKKTGSPSGTKKQIKSDIDFVIAQIFDIRDLEHFEDFFQNNSDNKVRNALRIIAYAVLKHLHSKCIAEFVTYGDCFEKDQKNVYLRHNDFVISKETTKKIHKAMEETFEMKFEDKKKKNPKLSIRKKKAPESDKPII